VVQDKFFVQFVVFVNSGSVKERVNFNLTSFKFVKIEIQFTTTANTIQGGGNQTRSETVLNNMPQR
jgi:hypothetical protein